MLFYKFYEKIFLGFGGLKHKRLSSSPDIFADELMKQPSVNVPEIFP